MKKLTIFLALLTVALAAQAQVSPSEAVGVLMPKPQRITADGTSFALGRAVKIDDPTDCELLAALFTTDDDAAVTVSVRLVSDADLGTFDYTLAAFPNEGYRLSVTPDAIAITAASPTGVIRAAQTLRQLADATGGTAIASVEVTDYPAFKLRGFMHDVGRSFITFDELLKEIDLLARFKVNVFHWHLTDNQGFRFESKAFPALNSAANMTRFPGLYYTQAQCTELERYAASRGITVIPEIDMPGHSATFTSTMGFTMSSDQGRAVLKTLLGELATAFPLAPYIHMGADEAGTTAAFVNEMSQYIHDELGRRCIVWNPISGVSISTATLPYIDMTEMWSTSGKKIDGVPNIDCRYNYVNHFDVFADLVGIYKSNIYYAERGSAELAGAITAVWNDRKTPGQTDIIAQNNLFANALATAERGWMGGGRQYIETGGTTLPNSGEEYEEFCDWERRFLYYKDTWLADEPVPYVRQTDVRWRITDAFPNGGDAQAVFPPEESTDDLLPDAFAYNGQTYATGMATGAGIYLRHTWGTTVPSYYTNPALNHTAYAWTYVYSPEEQTAGALVEFQNYGRSENDQAPDAGQWDRKGSRLWLNGEELLPPAWGNTGRTINAEADLLNENLTAREPLQVTLRKGWNKVFLKLPYVTANGVRLNKWMFTFVLTTPDGRHALDGITYSPNQCLDDAAEQVATLISEINRYVLSVTGDAPGYYPTTSAAELLALVADVKVTLGEALSADEREAQKAQLQTAFDGFKSALATTELNQPLATTDGEEHVYVLYTPLRGSRYCTSNGAGGEAAGIAAPTQASYWTFRLRTDGTYDIVNYADGTYLSPASTYNTVLYTRASQPTAGWSLAPADELGYFIITSTLNSCQLNQTNLSSSAASGGYKVYNWGNGTNTSDTGCKYRIEEVPYEELHPVIPGLPADGGWYHLVNVQQDGTTYPLFVSDGTLAAANADTDPATLGDAAIFRCDSLAGGKYNFVARTDGSYLIWRGGSSGGYNSNKGLLATYNATYCDWQLTSADATLAETFYMAAKRSNGTTDGTLVLLRAGTFDAYSNTLGLAANYSNLFRFVPADVTAVSGSKWSMVNGQSSMIYDLQGRPVSFPAAGVYIVGGRKFLLP
ncbi:MAG: family 20 glycosylhydrolase [Bacteroidaceae bacterium]|nr:family 20 glycosylhydrolase [Bacteroidaceae bacterium]